MKEVHRVRTLWLLGKIEGNIDSIRKNLLNNERVDEEATEIGYSALEIKKLLSVERREKRCQT